MSAPSRIDTRAALPLGLIGQAIPKLSRHDLEVLTERLIEYLDAQDGDPDLEPSGDEMDGSLGEDDFCEHSLSWKREPGCPLSDPDHDGSGFDCEENALTPDYGIDQTQAIPDAYVIACDRDAMKVHVRRLQATRCVKLPRRDLRGRSHRLVE